MNELNFYAILFSLFLGLVGTPIVLRFMGYGWSKVIIGSLVGLLLVLLLSSVINRVTEPLDMPFVWLAPLIYLGALVWGYRNRHRLLETENAPQASSSEDGK